MTYNARMGGRSISGGSPSHSSNARIPMLHTSAWWGGDCIVFGFFLKNALKDFIALFALFALTINVTTVVQISTDLFFSLGVIWGLFFSGQLAIHKNSQKCIQIHNPCVYACVFASL